MSTQPHSSPEQSRRHAWMRTRGMLAAKLDRLPGRKPKALAVLDLPDQSPGRESGGAYAPLAVACRCPLRCASRVRHVRLASSGPLKRLGSSAPNTASVHWITSSSSVHARCDACRRESGADQFALLSVLRIVHRQHEAAQDAADLRIVRSAIVRVDSKAPRQSDIRAVSRGGHRYSRNAATPRKVAPSSSRADA
jgi:hypothetical protein